MAKEMDLVNQRSTKSKWSMKENGNQTNVKASVVKFGLIKAPSKVNGQMDECNPESMSGKMGVPTKANSMKTS